MAALFDPHFQDIAADGRPRSGALLWFYEGGTTTPITVYQDEGAATPHANPVVADSAGLFSPIYITDTRIKFILQTEDGETIQTVDNMVVIPNGEEVVQGIVAGSGIVVDDTDPAFPRISAPTLIPSGASVLAYMTADQVANVEANLATVDVSDAINAAIAENDYIVLPPHRMLISGTIGIVDGLTIQSDNATLVTTTVSINVLSAVSKEGFRLVGVLNIEGSYADGAALEASGNRDPSAQNGVYFDSCRNFAVGTIFAKNLRGAAFKMVPTAGNWTGITYGKRGGIDHLQAENCEFGLDITATGTIASQYVIWGRIDSVRNHIGVQHGGGNQVFQGGNTNGNDIGWNLVNGAGHLHSIVSNFNINHNLQSVVGASITEGQTFSNCHIYEGDMEFDTCDAIVFEGGLLDINNITYLNPGASAGRVRFRNMMRLDAYGPLTITGNTSGNVILTNCFGVGAAPSTNRSMDGEFAALAFRAPASTQSVTSGTPATVILPSEQIDAGAGYSTSTGVYTCPDAGVYEVCWNIVASGTSMTPEDSLLAIQTSTSAAPSTFGDYVVSLPKLFGTTRLGFDGTTRVTMQKGAAIRLRATITGTTPVIGDDTYYCILNIRKVA